MFSYSLVLRIAVMRMLLLAGFLVVSPGVVVILWFINRPLWILPAAASVAINILPFIVAVLLLRAQKRKGAEPEMDAH